MVDITRVWRHRRKRGTAQGVAVFGTSGFAEDPQGLTDLLGRHERLTDWMRTAGLDLRVSAAGLQTVDAMIDAWRDDPIVAPDHIVLSALDKTPGLTQVELAKTVGLDKTTLMSQLDRLEQQGLVVRRPDPRDRRARIPALTEAGDQLRSQVATASTAAEATALSSFSERDVAVFRRMLFELIGDSTDPGSCL